MHHAVLNNHIKAAKLLIEDLKLDVNAQNIHGQTPLRFAVENGNTKMVKLLVSFDAEVNQNITPYSETLLHCAVRRSDIKMAEQLVSLGADVNITGQEIMPLYEITPLQRAAQSDDIEMVDMLTRFADVNVHDKYGVTPLGYATVRGDLEMVKMLAGNARLRKTVINKKDYLGMTPLVYAVINDDIEMVKLLIDLDADVNTKDSEDMVPLSHAIIKGNIEIAKLLANFPKTDVNVKTTDNRYTLLYRGIRHHNIEMAAMVTHLDNVNTRNAGMTPLHFAVRGGHTEIVRLLVEKLGADVNARDVYDRTPLDHIVLGIYSKIEKILTKKALTFSPQQQAGSLLNSELINENPVDEFVFRLR